MKHPDAQLQQIPTRQIDRNPENPRILFRPGELNQLIDSVRQYGVQVPIAVYREHRRYVLIDGERRWLACLKLNKETIPAIVQPKPAPLTNLLLMFNIHALREQWDLLTIAMKLPRVMKLLAVELGTKPNERQLSGHTGLTIGLIRRCKLLIELPDHHKATILDELKKPKASQRLTEDFFIEMERALKTAERAMPGLVEDKDRVREILIDKYKRGIIPNIVQFRQVAKIARAENVDADRSKAKRALKKLFSLGEFSIADAYEESVSEAYLERNVLSRIDSLLGQLQKLASGEVDATLLERLTELHALLGRLLRAWR